MEMKDEQLVQLSQLVTAAAASSSENVHSTYYYRLSPVQVTVHFVKCTVFCAYFRTDIPIPDKSFIPPKCQKISAKRYRGVRCCSQ